MTDQAHFLNDIPAYALGALDALERENLEAHLAGCPLCQAELRSYQDVVAAVALSSPTVQPPARLKQAIFKNIAAQSKSSAPKSSLPRTGFWNTLFSRLRPSPAFSIGAAVMIVALLASNILLWKQVNDFSAMQRHGYSSVVLTATNKAPNASGMIVYTLDGKSGFLVVNGLKWLPASQQYQLWLVKSGKRTSGGVFSVGQEGYQVLEVSSNQLLTSYDSFGITIEPAGGSPGPTGDKVLGGKF